MKDGNWECLDGGELVSLREVVEELHGKLGRELVLVEREDRLAQRGHIDLL